MFHTVGRHKVYRSRRRWKLVRSKEQKWRIGAAVGLSVTVWAWVHDTGRLALDQPRGTGPQIAREVAEARNDSRIVYPYSVIPGGVRDAGELERALQRDPVAALHYAGIDASRAVVTIVRQEEMVYVSYRLQDRIFWTSRRVRLAPHEYLLVADGRRIRTRCGNQVSGTPRQPVAKNEPSLPAVELPQFDVTVLNIHPENAFAPPILSAEHPALPLQTYFDIVTPPPAEVAGVEDSWPRLDRIPPLPFTPVPEPAAFVLAAGALAALVYRDRTRKRRS